jgi:hypothetical protein
MDCVSKRLHRPAKSRRRHRDSLDAAVGIYLCAYSALAGCFFFGLYEFMQPSRYANSGMAAYKPAPATRIAFVPFRARDEVEPAPLEAFASAIEPASEATSKMAAKPDKPTVSKRRVRTARHQEPRRLIMRYGAQPFFGGYWR